MGIKGTGAFNKEVCKVTASEPTKFLTTPYISMKKF